MAQLPSTIANMAVSVGEGQLAPLPHDISYKNIQVVSCFHTCCVENQLRQITVLHPTKQIYVWKNKQTKSQNKPGGMGPEVFTII